MKYLIYIAIIIFNGCNAQKKVNMEQEMIIPQVNKEFETIDPNIFDGKGSNFEVVLENEHLIYTSADIGYGKSTFFTNSYFKSLTSYYKNEKNGVRKKGIMFINGSKYGTWYEFNENGLLINEINTDEGYEYSWENIIDYCSKNEIKLSSGYPNRGGIKTEIYQNEDCGLLVWTISYFNTKKSEYLEITLDGKTGKEIKRRELEFIGG
ncbi:hypothetical protein ULMS_18650 [Patiriisocius marinistellae]|uniref:Uncharacterized protein n=1 Tax=Patiriisocius marinistellae TaxID=2494560 RepID=A0A5J4FUN6_9FLAO|nr:hypothetical protein [Patiriisocius marinistellae]GEQ86357.1 hypothetical protein ULMS_18650 [Patiriisocius marinistellae]